MPRPGSILRVALAASLASAALARPADDQPDSHLSPAAFVAVEVKVVGHAAADRPDARQAALEDALRHAVEAGAGVHVASESVTNHAELTRDSVTVTSAGRVRSHHVVEEGPDDAGRYAVRLRADVVPNADGPPQTGDQDPRDGALTSEPAPAVQVVVEGQPQTAAHAAQRLRELGLRAQAATGGDGPRPHDSTLVLHTTQRCVAAPDAYGVSLVRADVSITATLVPGGSPSHHAAPHAEATATHHAFGTTVAAAAGRAHQRALDAALKQVLNAGHHNFSAASRNP